MKNKFVHTNFLKQNICDDFENFDEVWNEFISSVQNKFPTCIIEDLSDMTFFYDTKENLINVIIFFSEYWDDGGESFNFDDIEDYIEIAD